MHSIVRELQDLIAENKSLKVKVKTLAEENQVLQSLKNKLLNSPQKIILEKGDRELIAERDRALALAKDCLSRLEKLTRDRDYRKALLEAELIRYQLKQYSPTHPISVEEQNKKLQELRPKKLSNLFDW